MAPAVCGLCPAPAGAQGKGALLLNTGVHAPRLVPNITEHVFGTVKADLSVWTCCPFVHDLRCFRTLVFTGRPLQPHSAWFCPKTIVLAGALHLL